MIYLAVFLWWAVGFASFVYWWTKDYDLLGEEIVIGVMAGFGGPIAFLVGWLIHGDKRVIIKRRGNG